MSRLFFQRLTIIRLESISKTFAKWGDFQHSVELILFFNYSWGGLVTTTAWNCGGPELGWPGDLLGMFTCICHEHNEDRRLSWTQEGLWADADGSWVSGHRREIQGFWEQHPKSPGQGVSALSLWKTGRGLDFSQVHLVHEVEWDQYDQKYWRSSKG